ncbi:MAG: molybdenum cofactor biosynthesis F family protein [Desulfobacteraceae bacterium]|nr:molybdenum cofactor biosynthesis F family protein [Desulfobacteraceae bacterium]
MANNEDKPGDWKDYDDFAAGIDTNRLPQSEDLIGKRFAITLCNGEKLSLDFPEKNSCKWSDDSSSDNDWYESVNVAPNTYLLDITFTSRPRDSRTLIVNTETRRVLSVLTHVLEEKVPGDPQVTQQFLPGVLGDEPPALCSIEPGPTRDLIGLREFSRYSPNHLYEHIYLSSTRYAWQNLIGEQRGHGDVDLATTYKFDENQYVFSFREFIIPVATVFFFNFDEMRSTGKFLGITSEGKIQNTPAGAYMYNASMTYYEKGCEPV